MRIIDWNSDGCSSDLVVYRPEVPEWALPADLDAAMAKGESIVLLDEQVRIEDGVVHSFSDIAYRIDNTEALTQLGTLKLRSAERRVGNGCVSPCRSRWSP